MLTENEMETMNERHTCTLKPNAFTHAHTYMPFNQTHVKKENAHQKLKSKTEIKREKKMNDQINERTNQQNKHSNSLTRTTAIK